MFNRCTFHNFNDFAQTEASLRSRDRILPALQKTVSYFFLPGGRVVASTSLDYFGLYLHFIAIESYRIYSVSGFSHSTFC